MQSPDQLTLLVFKDNLVARTFQLPLKWITRFSWVLALLFATATVGSLLAIKYYRISSMADPQLVQDLLHERESLKAAYNALELRMSQAPQVADSTPAAAPIEKPIVTQQTAAPAGTALIFSALPADIQPLPQDPSVIPVRLQAAKAEWMGRKLRVSFNIQYVQSDGGSLQGRIIVLARGPDSLFAYPEGTINPVGSQTLVALNKGEYFSVSRFREVRAEFPQKGITGVDILLISQAGQLIFHEKLKPTTAAAIAPARPAIAQPAVKPSPEISPKESVQ